jgi:predicted RNase H-like nuclease (RuvC/YqgF family)
METKKNKTEVIGGCYEISKIDHVNLLKEVTAKVRAGKLTPEQATKELIEGPTLSDLAAENQKLRAEIAGLEKNIEELAAKNAQLLKGHAREIEIYQEENNRLDAELDNARKELSVLKEAGRWHQDRVNELTSTNRGLVNAIAVLGNRVQA